MLYYTLNYTGLYFTSLQFILHYTVQCTYYTKLHSTHYTTLHYISYRVTGLYRLGKSCYLHSLLCNNSIIAANSIITANSHEDAT